MRILQGHAAHVRSLAFGPDGRTMASAAMDGSVRLWDLTRFEARLCLPPGPKPRFIPREGVASLFDILFSLLGGLGSFMSLAFAPHGKTLALGSDSVVRLWDVPSGEERGVLDVTGHVSAALCFSDDGMHLTSAGPAGLDGTPCFADLRAWDLTTGRQRITLMTSARGLAARRSPSLFRSAFALSEGQVACEYGEQVVAVGNVATANWHLYLEVPDTPLTLAFSPNGQWLAVGGERVITLWDLPPLDDTGRPGDTALLHSIKVMLGVSVDTPYPPLTQPRATFEAHNAPVRALAFNAESTTLLSGSDDGTVREWDLETSQHVRALDWEIGKVACVAFSRDDLTAAAGGESGAIVLWDLEP